MRAILCLLATAALMAAPPKLGLIDTLKVGAEGSWDYVTVDAEAGRIYLPRSTHTLVLDLAGRVLADFPGTNGVHGVAISRELDRGWTSNGRDNSVTIFKLSTLAVEKVVKIEGRNPDAILFEPTQKRVFTFNGTSKDVTVLNALTGEIVGTIPVADKPEFSAHDGKGNVYVNLENTGFLGRINAKTMKLETKWTLGLEGPSGLAIDVKAGLLFSVGDGRMAISDAKAGKVIATVPIGKGSDGVAFDPATGCAYSSNGGDGTLTVVGRDAKGAWAALATVPTKRGARTIGLDTKSHKLYLPAADYAAPAADAKPGTRPTLIPGSFQLVVVGEIK
jgi:DNA-binding beta-propeller fold protein YncE